MAILVQFKMNRLVFLSSVLFVLLLVSVSAVVDLEIQESSLSLEGEPGGTVNGDFDLENTGNESFTVTFTENNPEKGNEEVNIDSISSVTLDVGETETVSFSLSIPDGQELGTYTGSIVAESGSASDSVSISLLVNASGGIVIEDLDVAITTLPRNEVESRSDFDSEREVDNDVTEGQRIDFEDVEILPGSELEFRLDVENTFSDSTEIDMEDVTVTITIVDIDDGDDLEVESEKTEINVEKSTPIDVVLNIPIDVIEDEYDVEVLVEAEGSDGEDYTAERNLKLTVDKDSRDLLLEDVSVFPSTLSRCPGTVTVSGNLWNIGSREEDEVVLEIKNNVLGINYKRENIILDDEAFDDDNRLRFSVPIEIPSGVRAQSYAIDVFASLQANIPWDSKRLTLNLNSCQEEVEEEAEEEVVAEPEVEEEPVEEAEEESETEVSVPTESAEEEAEETANGGSTKVPVLKPSATTESTTTQSPLFWALLVFMNIIIIVVVVFVVARVLRK